MSVENLKTMIKLTESWCAFYYHHALVILNNINDKTFPIKNYFIGLRSIRAVVRDISCGSREWHEWEAGASLRRLLS